MPILLDSDPLPALDSGVDRLQVGLDARPGFHDRHQSSGDLLEGVDLMVLCEAGLIAEGRSRRLGGTHHVLACWTFLTNLQAALSARDAVVVELQARLQLLTDRGAEGQGHE